MCRPTLPNVNLSVRSALIEEGGIKKFASRLKKSDRK
jgi:hypothetical protein